MRFLKIPTNTLVLCPFLVACPHLISFSLGGAHFFVCPVTVVSLSLIYLRERVRPFVSGLLPRYKLENQWQIHESTPSYSFFPRLHFSRRRRRRRKKVFYNLVGTENLARNVFSFGRDLFILPLCALMYTFQSIGPTTYNLPTINCCLDYRNEDSRCLAARLNGSGISITRIRGFGHRPSLFTCPRRHNETRPTTSFLLFFIFLQWRAETNANTCPENTRPMPRTFGIPL